MEHDSFSHDTVTETYELMLSRKEKRELGQATIESYHKTASETAETSPETRFRVDPADFPTFSAQIELEETPRGGLEVKNVNIDETLGKLVGATASTVEVLIGENPDYQKPDHVIYLDKSARPVGWLIDEFWNDFTDEAKPANTHLAIDRRAWLKKPFIEGELFGNEYIKNPDGSQREAHGSDFKIENVPLEYLAGIHGLYVDGGIPDLPPEEIMKLPTVLDNKNITIIDEVSRSGATLHIAKELLKAAIPEVASVEGYTFWHPGTTSTGQMKSAPAWYSKSEPTGRGVKDINELYYKNLYQTFPANETRAFMRGAFVLGEPLTEPEKETGQKSLRLREEIGRVHDEYIAGHILPSMTDNPDSKVADRLFDKLENLGVEFIPADRAKNNPRAYINLLNARKRPAQ